MKRALAILVALCTFGALGFSQIAIKGSWTATVCLLPTTTLSSTLSLTYTVAGFDVTSTTGFGATGLTSQAFSLKGAFGPFAITGKMAFDVTAPAYLRSQLVTGFDFGGVAIGLTVNHWLDGAWSAGYFGYPTGTLDPCDPTIVGGNLQYVLTSTIAPVSVRVRFLDCSAGTAFQDLRVTLTGVGLCCGITYNATFSFNKQGFDSLSITGINVPLCCGVSFDIGVTYTVQTKSLTVTPKFAGIGDACFTVWGGPVTSGTFNQIWGGIEVYGFRIRCTIADCNYIEFVNAFNVSAVNPLLPSADRFLGACGEFELVKIGFCGPGCCGGKYDVTLRVFFGTAGGIFDITRFVYAVNIPIMTNFTLNLTGTMPAAACAAVSFCLGWTFTF